jgi:protein-S-isoprenylcysteine O-methyltransferase Ste14
MEAMMKSIILIIIWAVAIFGWLVPHWLIPVIKRKFVCEVSEGVGMAIFITLITVGWLWIGQQITWLAYIGLALYIPAALFVIPSFMYLKHKGTPKDGWEDTTQLVDTGVYRITRHPMYFGSALFTLGVVLVQQSIISIIPGIIAVILFFIASKGEEKKLINKFGDAYKEYMRKVPFWPLMKGRKTD